MTGSEISTFNDWLLSTYNEGLQAEQGKPHRYRFYPLRIVFEFSQEKFTEKEIKNYKLMAFKFHSATDIETAKKIIKVYEPHDHV